MRIRMLFNISKQTLAVVPWSHLSERDPLQEVQCCTRTPRNCVRTCVFIFIQCSTMHDALSSQLAVMVAHPYAYWIPSTKRYHHFADEGQLELV